MKHINNFIELGWQNLSTSTDHLTVSRALAAEGPWTPLLNQTNPDATGPYTIRLVDNTIGTPHYYKLDTFVGTIFIYGYGPLLLQ